MDEEILNNAPFAAWIHNLSKNQLKYLNLKLTNLNLGHELRYIMFIHDNPDSSQDDLVKALAQSKGNIAKVLRKLEDNGYIERKINPNNRRKYMLKTTSKADRLIPRVREISREWEIEVGLTEADEDLKKRIKELSINSIKLIEE